MNALIVFSHPNPKSFNAAIRDTVKSTLEAKGAQVKVKDLYAMNWNPVLSAADFTGFQSGQIPQDIAAEQADVRWADLIVFISPVWWMGVTAMLRGWVDRVFSYGFAYEYTATGPRGMLSGKKGLLITTSGANEQMGKASGLADTIEKQMIQSTFGFTSIAPARYMNCYNVPNATDDERKQMLEQVKAFAAESV